ncbi:PP0621 family protein [uncultured Propionivibrio sp.]|uniref:PP0621 family protein n=1 Tax=uncultured Propionivibrio sp. TaxID=426737 RepID=UPI003748A31D
MFLRRRVAMVASIRAGRPRVNSQQGLAPGLWPQTVPGASDMLVGMKLLLWLLFGVLAYSLWRAHQRRRAARPSVSERQAERMVRCERCGVHLPIGECVEHHGSYYCCHRHADAGNDGNRS